MGYRLNIYKIKEEFKKVLEEYLNDINEDNLKDYYLLYWS